MWSFARWEAGEGLEEARSYLRGRPSRPHSLQGRGPGEPAGNVEEGARRGDAQNQASEQSRVPDQSLRGGGCGEAAAGALSCLAKALAAAAVGAAWASS